MNKLLKLISTTNSIDELWNDIDYVSEYSSGHEHVTNLIQSCDENDVRFRTAQTTNQQSKRSGIIVTFRRLCDCRFGIDQMYWNAFGNASLNNDFTTIIGINVY